jgi:hypothetical protein
LGRAIAADAGQWRWRVASAGDGAWRWLWRLKASIQSSTQAAAYAANAAANSPTDTAADATCRTFDRPSHLCRRRAAQDHEHNGGRGNRTPSP